MNMNIWSLTYEKVNELEELIKNQTKEYEILKNSKPEDLWKKDLEEFIKLYQKVINNVIKDSKKFSHKNLSNTMNILEKDARKRSKVNIKRDKNKGIKFQDYKIIGILGTGSFGRVFKVKIKDDVTEKIYAMKVINKNLLIRKKQLKYAVGDCSVLKKCDCPFIVKLYYSFQTLENL